MYPVTFIKHLWLKMVIRISYILGNCNVEFFNFCHCQVQNFEILNLLEWNQNFAVNFRKHWKRNGESTMYIATEHKQSIIPIKFCEISLVSWILIKCHNFSLNSVKVRKDFRKILLKWLEKTFKYQLNSINFHSCHEK